MLTSCCLRGRFAAAHHTTAALVTNQANGGGEEYITLYGDLQPANFLAASDELGVRPILSLARLPLGRFHGLRAKANTARRQEWSLSGFLDFESAAFQDFVSEPAPSIDASLMKWCRVSLEARCVHMQLFGLAKYKHTTCTRSTRPVIFVFRRNNAQCSVLFSEMQQNQSKLKNYLKLRYLKALYNCWSGAIEEWLVSRGVPDAGVSRGFRSARKTR